MSDLYRPQPFWLAKGAILGAGSGAAVGVLLMVGDLWGRVEEPDTAYVPEGWWDAIVIGIFFGGIGGVIIGLPVGAMMAVLLSGHLPLDVQRRRAFLLGTALPPLTLLTVFALLAGGLQLHDWRDLGVVLVPGLIGGPLARWAAAFQLPRPPVS